ncbi:MAG: hypothetical protein EAZ30_17290 [Betaproteobacteria bacterium]|nr:MAG: hypothetical protein EAZ30_17290 [Betaproteobacteria bacterium]
MTLGTIDWPSASGQAKAFSEARFTFGPDKDFREQPLMKMWLEMSELYHRLADGFQAASRAYIANILASSVSSMRLSLLVDIRYEPELDGNGRQYFGCVVRVDCENDTSHDDEAIIALQEFISSHAHDAFCCEDTRLFVTHDSALRLFANNDLDAFYAEVTREF